jgi:sulfate adenylyltransferase
MAKLIEPHGGKGLTICLLEGAELEAEKTKAAGLKKITISPRVKGDLIMLGNGGFSPLTGFMTKADWKGVCESFLTADGTFWPVPVTLDVSSDDAAGIADGDEIALYDPEGDEIMATMKVTEKWEESEADKIWECEKVFMGEGTPTKEEFWKIAKDDHPGVQMVMGQKEVNLAGPVKVLSEGDYPTGMPAFIIARRNPARFSRIAAGRTLRPCSCATPCTAPTNTCARLPWKSATACISIRWSAT